MTTGKSKLDAAFITQQQRLLTRLRSSLKAAAQSTETDERDVNAASANSAREYEEDAQNLAALELDGNLVARDNRRLERVERALEKISNGTYGLSDLSGAAIPRERLEAVPEAIYTLSEEQSREGK
jgi:DnaK suppressor protein